MYIVGFNGPPFSGKDTMARMLAEHMDSQGVTIPVVEASLSTPLREIAYAMVGWEYDPRDHDEYTRFKEHSFPQFGNTGRRLMIDVSECFLKKQYGISVMARLLLAAHKDFHGVLLVRDSGFQCEINPLVDAVGVDNLMVVRVERPGYDFSNDSREWVTHKHIYQADNSGSLTDLRSQAETLYTCLKEFMGWKL